MIKQDIIFINHISENITNIYSFVKDIKKSDFLENEEKQYAVIRALEIIGEAVKNISQEIKSKYPQVQWKAIAGTRDKIIHSYFDVNLNIVWAIIHEDLGIFKKQIQDIKKDIEKNSQQA